MRRVFATMSRPEVGALFGSYDADPDDVLSFAFASH
jgi:hypothetical protein